VEALVGNQMKHTIPPLGNVNLSKLIEEFGHMTEPNDAKSTHGLILSNAASIIDREYYQLSHPVSSKVPDVSSTTKFTPNAKELEQILSHFKSQKQGEAELVKSKSCSGKCLPEEQLVLPTNAEAKPPQITMRPSGYTFIRPFEGQGTSQNYQQNAAQVFQKLRNDASSQLENSEKPPNILSASAQPLTKLQGKGMFPEDLQQIRQELESRLQSQNDAQRQKVEYLNRQPEIENVVTKIPISMMKDQISNRIPEVAERQSKTANSPVVPQNRQPSIPASVRYLMTTKPQPFVPKTKNPLDSIGGPF
jgi:hypothetical protein